MLVHSNIMKKSLIILAFVLFTFAGWAQGLRQTGWTTTTNAAAALAALGGQPIGGGGSATNALINGPGGNRDAILITNVPAASLVGSLVNQTTISNSSGNTATLNLVGNPGTGGINNSITSTPGGITLSGTLNIGNILNLGAGGVNGLGSGLTGLNASALSSGTVPSTVMPAFTGDITTSSGSVSTTLKNTGTAGTYTKSTFDSQGRETSGTTLANSDIPSGYNSVTNLTTNGLAGAASGQGIIIGPDGHLTNGAVSASIPNGLITNNAAGTWTNNSGVQVVSSTVNITNGLLNTSNANVTAKLNVGTTFTVDSGGNVTQVANITMLNGALKVDGSGFFGGGNIRFGVGGFTNAGNLILTPLSWATGASVGSLYVDSGGKVGTNTISGGSTVTNLSKIIVTNSGILSFVQNTNIGTPGGTVYSPVIWDYNDAGNTNPFLSAFAQSDGAGNFTNRLMKLRGFDMPIIQAGVINVVLVASTTQGILFPHPMPNTNYVPVVVLNGVTIPGQFASNLTTNGFTENMTALTFNGPMLWTVTGFTK